MVGGCYSQTRVLQLLGGQKEWQMSTVNLILPFAARQSFHVSTDKFSIFCNSYFKFSHSSYAPSPQITLRKGWDDMNKWGNYYHCLIVDKWPKLCIRAFNGIINIEYILRKFKGNENLRKKETLNLGNFWFKTEVLKKVQVHWFLLMYHS